jgi:hypothetical protein
VAADPTDDAQEERQEKDKGSDNDDGSVDASLGILNTGPVQLKTDLLEPVTSGGIDTFSDNPGTTN